MHNYLLIIVLVLLVLAELALESELEILSRFI